jgi:hypothetical protein
MQMPDQTLSADRLSPSKLLSTPVRPGCGKGARLSNPNSSKHGRAMAFPKNQLRRRKFGAADAFALRIRARNAG